MSVFAGSIGLEKRLEAVEGRLAMLERGRNGENSKEVIEIDLTLPKDDIGGLHFNRTEVHAVFEKKEDGWYHSRDSLFISARNTEDDNSRDILTEYLNKHENSTSIKAQIALAVSAKRVTDIEISLPKENRGVKQYNGVAWWYWLADPYSGTPAHFCYVNNYGNAHHYPAGSVGGCAPVFRVAGVNG